MNIDTGEKILIIGAAVFALMLAFAAFIQNLALSINMLFVGIIALTVPYSIYRFFEFKKIKAYEGEFSGFLRDLADSQRAGLSTYQAIQTAAKSDYGSLTKEIRKINNQLSWNIPLEAVLKNFRSRMKGSRVITRSLMIIDQANKSGGNVDDTMDSLANNIEMIKDVEKEKSAMLNQHVIMMYAIFFMFLAITLSLLKFLIPMMQMQSEMSTTTAGLFEGFSSSPCANCIGSGGVECTPCSILSGMSSGFGLGNPDNAATYYRSLFLAMTLVQGFFSGMIVGQISSDSVAAGVKHSLVMVISGFALFILMVRSGFV